MIKNSNFFMLLIVVVLVVLLCCQGCTIKFKGKDIGLDTYSTSAFEFDGVEFTDGTDSQ